MGRMEILKEIKEKAKQPKQDDSDDDFMAELGL